VMYAGQVLERLNASELEQAKHPYTRGLLACPPEIDHRRRRLPVLERDPSWTEPVAP
jgi:peptide/nickel transport system ATP-binding protein